MQIKQKCHIVLYIIYLCDHLKRNICKIVTFNHNMCHFKRKTIVEYRNFILYIAFFTVIIYTTNELYEYLNEKRRYIPQCVPSFFIIITDFLLFLLNIQQIHLLNHLLKVQNQQLPLKILAYFLYHIFFPQSHMRTYPRPLQA